jgi:HAD superfamily hydrolase (TIGR01509 family)
MYNYRIITFHSYHIEFMLTHLLFDNDGTIVDSEILAVYAMLDRLAEHGILIDADTYKKRFPGLLTRDIIRLVQEESGVTLPANFLDIVHDDHEVYFDTQLKVIEGMDMLFRSVRLPKSMVSNGGADHVERCLRRVGLFDALDGQIFSAQHVERPKPHPDVYHHAMRTLAVEPHQTITIEDSEAGVRAAKAAGLRVIGFLGAAHIVDGHHAVLKAAGADYLAHDAAEVRTILGGFGAI